MENLICHVSCTVSIGVPCIVFPISAGPEIAMAWSIRLRWMKSLQHRSSKKRTYFAENPNEKTFRLTFRVITLNVRSIDRTELGERFSKEICEKNNSAFLFIILSEMRRSERWIVRLPYTIFIGFCQICLSFTFFCLFAKEHGEMLSCLFLRFFHRTFGSQTKDIFFLNSLKKNHNMLKV